MDFVTQNWEVIAGIVGGILGIAYGVTKFTKTKKDDAVVGLLAGLWQKLTGKK